MNTIKIVRLKNGEDIIGVLNDINGEYEITEPMSVSLVQRGQQSGLVMSHWLPVQLIKKNEIKINSRDVLTVFEPNDEFAEYYTNTVEKINELLKAKRLADEMTDEEIEDIMDALDDGEHQTLH
jgi:MinD-like ATPase involved in chromosome partitioning or flagellar assembly